MRTVAFGLGLALLVACGDDAARPTVSTGDGGPEPDAGRPQDAGPDSPRPDGGAVLPPADFDLELPYGGAAVVYELTGEASLGLLDLQLSVDTSASIDSEIDELQGNLERTILPSLRDVVPNLSVGVSRFEDFPRSPFGNPRTGSNRADKPFELLVPITSDEDDIEDAVQRLDAPLGIGGDTLESGAEALYQIATGEGYRLRNDIVIKEYDGVAARGGGTLGGVGFRPGALHVVLHITDAPSHHPNEYDPDFPNTHSLDDASAALAAIGARVVSIISNDSNDRYRGDTRRQLEIVARDTGAVTETDEDGECPHGIEGSEVPAYFEVCPLVFDVNHKGEGLAETFTTAITTLVNDIRFKRLTAVVANDPLGFVEQIRPVAVNDDSPEIEDLLPEGAPDGEPDTFIDARGRAPVVFEVSLRNVRLPPRDEPQVFRVVLRILGDDLIVDERTLRITVPAGELPSPPDEDAGR